MTVAWLIVDGYNFLYRADRPRDWQPRELEARRDRLIADLGQAAGSLAARITIVFDGRSAGRADAPSDPGVVDVRFSPADQTADTLIERLVLQAERPGDILVVTSDGPERTTVEAAGAATMACSVFLDTLRQHLDDRRLLLTRRAATRPPFSLGDRFPDLPAPGR